MLLIQSTAMQGGAQEMKSQLNLAVDLLNQMVMSIVSPQQFGVKPNWDNGSLTITAKTDILDKIAHLLLEVGLAYFPSVAMAKEAFFHKRTTSTQYGNLSPSDKAPVEVTCTVQ